MAVFVAIFLPRLSLEVFRPRWSPRTEHGCVVLERDKVIVMDAVAREAGVLPGMKRGGVTTLSPDAAVFDRSLEREQEMQREVAFGFLRFSPQVAICDEETIVMDVTASLRLFGGIRSICAQVRDVVRSVGVTARMSVAPTGQGSWLLAKRGRCRVLKLRSLERNLNALPFMVVQEVRVYADWFQGLGCRVLSDIRRLPRAGLKKRCGVDLLDSLDRAYGLSPELYKWLEVPPTFSVRTELPDRVEHAEAILFSARRLIVQLCGWLSAQQLALTHATVSLEHERGRQAVEPTVLEIALAEPSWHEEHLVRLLKERLGRTELPAAVLAVRLTVHFPEGGRIQILNAASPISARLTRLFCPIARNFDTHLPVEDVYAFNKQVFEEDRAIVERQCPEDLPIDRTAEVPILADRSSGAYRRALAEIGLGQSYTS
ncbi:hypothetical protein QZM42_05530 [Burkholderia vietnamiensis]|uniref:Y-family DNA polymerase n=1 Tax=Burkholderia vietnamiensis TaxID=60552 RepID=UPI002652EE38|nr:hypothetical protein [Burkholderia vietnamiensis]MDN7408006.1 hypothetical protein [Burkholderia vietnamiensis]